MNEKRYKLKKFQPDLEHELGKSGRFKVEFDVETAKLKLAHKLAELREGAGLTQAQLAKRMDISQQLVSRIESGSNNITLSTLIKFVDLLGVCIEVDFKKRKKQEVLEFV